MHQLVFYMYRIFEGNNFSMATEANHSLRYGLLQNTNCFEMRDSPSLAIEWINCKRVLTCCNL